jgi:lipoprotein-releasing system ATP-binding protein
MGNVMNDFLVLNDVRKSYKSGSELLQVLSGISATVKEGASVVITGESGSGKTTLLHLIAAMDVLDAGSIKVQGLELSQATELNLCHYRNKVIGLIFQFHYLLKEFTALENILIPARMAGESVKLAEPRAKDLLGQVGLLGRAHHYPGQLSGGERQRVALARALMNDPALILADEPTGNLDEKNATQVESLLFNLAQQHKKTLLLVTHSQRLASEGDVHWHLHGGCIQSSRTEAMSRRDL